MGSCKSHRAGGKSRQAAAGRLHPQNICLLAVAAYSRNFLRLSPRETAGFVLAATSEVRRDGCQPPRVFAVQLENVIDFVW